MQTSDLVTGIRPGLTEDIKQLRTGGRRTSTSNRAEIDRALSVLPIKLTKVGPHRDLRLVVQLLPVRLPAASVRLPGGTTLPVNYATDAARCNIG